MPNVGTCDIFDNSFCSPMQSLSPATKSYVSQLVQLPSPNNKSTIEYKANQYDKLIEKYKKQKKILSRKRAKICFLKKRLNIKQNQEKVDPVSFIEKTNFVSKNSKSLVTTQLLHKKRKPWLQNEKNLAISLFYKSPSAYKFMKKIILFYQV